MNRTSSTLSSSSMIKSSSVSTPQTTTTLSLNETLDMVIFKLFNITDFYQAADLIEPERFATRNIRIIMWTFCLLTYIIALPVVIRMIRTKFYLNLIDYFSFHIVLCAFIAWIPTLILLIYYRFEVFALRLCRLHYVILSANETVPICFVLYMIIERFFYAHPSFKQKFKHFLRMFWIHIYAIFTWLFIMLAYAIVSPFSKTDLNGPLSKYTKKKYCPYNFMKLRIIATTRSIIYFILFVPGLILIGFVLRYFYLMRGTNQVSPTEKLSTIRAVALLFTIVFYDIYIYYLEHMTQTHKTFLLVSILYSSFYLVLLLIIICTDQYWLQFLAERCFCFCDVFGKRRKPIIPGIASAEIEINSLPNASSAGHYSLVDDTAEDEFDRAVNGPEPTLRVIV